MIQKLRDAINVQTKVHIKEYTCRDPLKKGKYFLDIIKLMNRSDVEEKLT